MAPVTDPEPLIDPEVKAFVFSLASALGGSSAGDDGRYVLGDDALAVLRDIKRWLRLYDDKLARLDVARLLADANFVKNDLLEILASWPDEAVESSFRSKIALLCVDLLTQLTWPIETDTETATLARYLHVPALQKAQAAYKSAILQHPNADILRAVARLSLPALAQSREERTPTEDTIIKVVLYFFRNIALITQPADSAVDEVESGIDRSSTIDQFHQQDIFNLILTICSNMIDDLQTHDVEVLDIVFQIVKGVDIDDLFMDKQSAISARTRELKALMTTEKSMLAGYARYGPSRHNRFGTMMWLGREGGKKTTIFGPVGAAGNDQLSMAEMDNSKKWKRPKGPKKKDVNSQPSAAFSTVVALTGKGKRHLRGFVEQFLDSSFNPLFLAVRRAIEREAPRVLKVHTRQYLYLISWFLCADRARRQKRATDRKQRPSASNDPESFALVATVLNQETFVLLNRSMQRALDEKDWEELNAGMKCFTQILLTVQDMSESPLDEDQEISENILNRIFYEQSTHDRIIALLRSYKDQSFDYLDACTELPHVFLRLLERYSKQNVDMQVRSKRRARTKKKATSTSNGPPDEIMDRESNAEDVAEVQRQVSERKFDFNKFAARFINQDSVDTFLSLLRYFHDLTPDQLKRTHRFFYRVAFKMNLTVYLFRMDIISLFNKLVKGPDGLNMSNETYQDWEELVRQVFRRLMKKMEERPALSVELLFSKIPSSLFYLEHGYDNKVPKRAPRQAAELEIKREILGDARVGVAVTLLINQANFDVLNWLKEVLAKAASERKAWEEANGGIAYTAQSGKPGAEYAKFGDPLAVHPGDTPLLQPQPEDENRPKPPVIMVKPSSHECRTAMHKDKHVRLLLTVVGCERLDRDPEATETTWFIPSSLSSTWLDHYSNLIEHFEFSPPQYEDGRSAEEQVRRKTAPRVTRDPLGIDNSDTDVSVSHRLESGGPTLAARSGDRPPERSLKRQRRANDELLDQSVMDERREARKKLEAERNRKIKSDLFVHDSDDESDEERDRAFFNREREMREKVKSGLVKAVMGSGKKSKKSKKRKTNDVEIGREDGDLMSDGEDETRFVAKRRRNGKKIVAISDDDESDVEGSPRTPEHKARASMKKGGSTSSTATKGNESDADAETEAETDTPPSSQRPSSGPSSQALRPAIQNGDVAMSDSNVAASGSDKENNHSGPQKAPVRKNLRAGFIIDSDSDE